MSNTDKQLAELVAEEKKLLEQQKKRAGGAQEKDSLASRKRSGRNSGN